MHKPTKDEILQALDDLEEGKTITADMRVAVNQYQRYRVEAHLEHELNADGPREQELQRLSKARLEEGLFLIYKMHSEGLTPQERIRYEQLGVSGRTSRP
jgi:hypothetical protein